MNWLLGSSNGLRWDLSSSICTPGANGSGKIKSSNYQIVRNRESTVWTPRTRDKEEIIKSEAIRGVCGLKITTKMVTNNLWVIPTKKSHGKHLQIDEPKFQRKYLWKYQKRETLRNKRLGTRLREWYHYESLSHIRLQATHKYYKTWMPKSSNKEPTLSSHPLTQEHPNMKEHSHHLSTTSLLHFPLTAP